jgi:hypothetical protein
MNGGNRSGTARRRRTIVRPVNCLCARRSAIGIAIIVATRDTLNARERELRVIRIRRGSWVSAKRGESEFLPSTIKAFIPIVKRGYTKKSPRTIQMKAPRAIE